MRAIGALIDRASQGVQWKAAHLVGHGGGAHFAGDGALFEVAEGDVGPGVAVEVQQDVVEAHHCIVQLRYVVVRLYLHRAQLNVLRWI